jgi:biopolymer transport protein ExbB/TolQ
MADQDFWQGLRLMSSGLADAAKKASYSVGCGAGGLGLALWGVGVLGITGPASLLIPMAAFFLLARLGRLLDEKAKRRETREELEELIAMLQRISQEQLKFAEGQLKLAEGQREDFKQLAASQHEHIRFVSQKALEELREKIDRAAK